MIRRRLLAASISTSMAFASNCWAAAQPAPPTPSVASIERVAVTGAATPSHPDEVFVAFADKAISVDAGRVLIQSAARVPGPISNPQRSAVYLWQDGALVKIVEKGDLAPGGGGAVFGSIGGGTIHGDVIAYEATVSDFSLTGAYASVAGEHRALVTQQTPIVGASAPLAFSSVPSVEGGTVVLSADLADGSNAIILASLVGDQPRVLVDSNTPLPNQPKGLAQVSFVGGISNGRVVFHGSPTQILNPVGVYTVDLEGGVGLVADATVMAPDSSSGFGQFPSIYPSISGDTVAFNGVTAEHFGIYTRNLVTGEVRVVANEETPLPLLPGDVVTINGTPSIDGDNVAFLAGGTIPNSDLILFARYNGVIVRVAGTGDLLDGRTIRGVFIGPESLGGDLLAFHVTFTDGAQGVYAATLVPAPPAALLVLASMIGACRRRRS